jgi:hypothetical protein
LEQRLPLAFGDEWVFILSVSVWEHFSDLPVFICSRVHKFGGRWGIFLSGIPFALDDKGTQRMLIFVNFKFDKPTGIMSNVHIKIDLSFQQLTDIVKQLSPSEKLKLNDVIWDEKMEVPEEHQKIVLGRIKKSRQNPGRMLDWNKASRTLKP